MVTLNQNNLLQVSVRELHNNPVRATIDGGLKKSRISAKMLKKEGLGKNQIAYMKHIKIQSCHMGVIFTPNHMTWQSQQCVHTHSHIMCYHTGNVYCDVVPNVQALIFPTSEEFTRSEERREFF